MTSKPSNEDDMETAYKATLELMRKEIIMQTLSYIQDGDMQVENLKDFMKGYYANFFITTLRTVHQLNMNPSQDNPILFEEYFKKIISSEKLDKLLEIL